MLKASGKAGGLICESLKAVIKPSAPKGSQPYLNSSSWEIFLSNSACFMIY